MEFASAFEVAFARLQVRLEQTCSAGGAWHERTIRAMRTALEFAAAEPESARVLVVDALAEGKDGFARYERLMTYLAELLRAGRAESPQGAELPMTTERSLAGGIATIVANRLDRDEARGLARLLPELIQFVLTPYFGTEGARRIAAEGCWPSGQSDR